MTPGELYLPVDQSAVISVTRLLASQLVYVKQTDSRCLTQAHLEQDLSATYGYPVGRTSRLVAYR